MFAYPIEFPYQEIKNVVAIVRSGEIVANRQVLVHDIWVVQGYAQHTIIGAPAEVATPTVSAQSVEDPLSLLEKAAAQAEGDTVTAQFAIPWGVIAKYLAELLLKIVLET